MPPRARRHREHPLTQRYVDAIALRAYSIVDLPSEADNVRDADTVTVASTATAREIHRAANGLPRQLNNAATAALIAAAAEGKALVDDACAKRAAAELTRD